MVARENKGFARMERQSAGLTETASTFTRASSAAGAGFSTSAIRSVSGGPYFSLMNAFITPGCAGAPRGGRPSRDRRGLAGPSAPIGRRGHRVTPGPSEGRR